MNTFARLHPVIRFARILLVFGSGALCTAMGQSSQTFDVAAIRVNTIGASAGTGVNFDGFRLRATNATLQFLIQSAYKIQGEQIIGGPAWLDEDRYDIEASTGSTQTQKPSQERAMLQNLLADRFSLSFHRETRQMTVLALVAGKNGVRFKEDTESAGTSLSTEMNSGKAVLSGTAVSMEQFAGYIGNKLGRLVLNKTDFNSAYDFTFQWDTGQAAGSTDPSIFTGLSEQLGRRLESVRSPVDVLVIDHVRKPSDN